MSAGEILLWVILPYVAITVFVVGHWWRYRTDQFAWTSRSTQLLDRRVLGWASPAFHYGALAAIGGHVIGLCIPPSLTDSLGISERLLPLVRRDRRGIAGDGDVGRLPRAPLPPHDQPPGAPHHEPDGHAHLFPAHGADPARLLDDLRAHSRHRQPVQLPRHDRGVVALAVLPRPGCQRGAGGAAASTSCTRSSPGRFWAAFPFSRLVHAWSIPLQYVGRPYILYRRRYNPGRTTIR